MQDVNIGSQFPSVYIQTDKQDRDNKVTQVFIEPRLILSPVLAITKSTPVNHLRDRHPIQGGPMGRPGFITTKCWDYQLVRFQQLATEQLDNR